MKIIFKILMIVGYALKKIIKDKVGDLCHITGKYRDPAHKECNSKLRIPQKITNYFS